MPEMPFAQDEFISPRRPAAGPAVLVNGLPGAGKSTLARTLSARLGLPLFSKDAVKEAHADVLGAEPPPGWTQRRWNTGLGTAAGETLWTLLADAPGGAVLESCWLTDARRFVVAGLLRAGAPQPLEIWCDVPPETARRRFEARHPRHPVHGELLTDDEWERRLHDARPLGIGPVLRIATTGPVDVDAVLAWIGRQVRAVDGESVVDPI